MDSMAVSNIFALIEENRGVKTRLGLNRSTTNRWLTKKSQPHAREFFGLVVVGLREELSELTLPTLRTVMWDAVRRTLALIRQKDCQQGWRLPTWKEFASVREFHRHPKSNLLLGASDPLLVGDVITSVTRRLAQQFPREQVWENASVKQAIVEWALPYVLFRIGLLDKWTFLDDEAFRYSQSEPQRSRR
jgi:hypothetical protein